MDEIRIAIVGLGGRGLGWLRLLDRMEGYRITAICDPVVALHARARAALARSEEVAVLSRYEEVLESDRVDAIGLCVRCPEQGALAAQGLEAGKHVHSEVPAAHTLEDCWRIVLAVERTGKFYQLAEQTRHWGFVDAWRDLVAQGALGRVTYCEGQYFGYYGTAWLFREPETGAFRTIEELPSHPNARPSWGQRMPPIHYLPHELSPMLKVLDDRVVEVTAMSTGSPSYSHPEVSQPDMQVALMRTERDTLLRMATSFTQPIPHHHHHWYQVIGTRGRVEWNRGARERPKLWLADGQMHDFAEVDWRYERADASAEARGSGHGDADFYVHAAFRDALLHGRTHEFDVYRAVETAAPAILAADSIAQETRRMLVPDFRPGPARAAGLAASS